MKLANEIKPKVEALHAAKVSGISLDNETAAWVARIGDELAGKLAAVALIADRTKPDSVSLGGLVRQVIERRGDAKPRTLMSLNQAAAKLLSHVGASTPLDTITTVGVDEWVAALRMLKYAPA